MSGIVFRSKRDIRRIRQSVKTTERAGRQRGSQPRKRNTPDLPGTTGKVALFRCGPNGCLQYRLVNLDQVTAGNAPTLFNSVTGWSDVDDACSGDDGGSTFNTATLTQSLETNDVAVLSSDDDRMYQQDADGSFYEIP